MTTDDRSEIKGSDRTSYRVDITYREPGFEEQSGLGPHPYGGTFEVVARDANEAIHLAIEEFRRIEELSWVGWQRVIVSMDVQRLEGEVEASLRATGEPARPG